MNSIWFIAPFKKTHDGKLNPIFVRFHGFYRSRKLYIFLLKCTFCWEFVPVIFALAEVNWTSWYRMCHKMQHISKWVLGQDAVAFQNTTLSFQCQRSYYDTRIWISTHLSFVCSNISKPFPNLPTGKIDHFYKVLNSYYVFIDF